VNGRRGGKGGIPIAVAAALALAAATRASGQELVFGMSGPFSGVAREMGKNVRTGIEVAFAAQNDAGGVNGTRLRLLALDDGSEPARTAEAVKDLIYARKVFGIVGNVGTAGAELAVPLANEKGVLFFGAVSGASFLRNNPPDRYVFNYRASYAEETAAIVRYLVDVRHIAPARIAVFSQDDAFGDAGFEGVARIMRQYRQDPAKVLRVRYHRNTADVEGAVREVAKRSKDLGAVVMVATYKAAARFIERLREAKVRGLVLTNVSDVGANTLADELAQLGPGYGEGVVVTQVVPPPTSAASSLASYQEQLRKYAPTEKPGFHSLEGWISARLLIEGLKRAGRGAGVEAVVDALEGIRGLDLGLGTALGFGPSEHQASHRVWGTVIDAKGQLQPLELP
jgi:ABC-type branched-subunit amino acid transport system substrate-binding protein